MVEVPAALLGARIIAILRAVPLQDAIAIAERTWDTGFGAVEVPLQDAAAADVLTALADRATERGEIVGAGTITTVDRFHRAVSLGAAFTVAPGTHPAVIQASNTAGLPHLPGVATGTEIQAAFDLGCTWLKAFPAAVLGPPWFELMRGPFPDARFVATGGVTAANAASFISAGAISVGVGSALSDPAEFDRLVAAL